MLLANLCGEVADKIFSQQADSFGPEIAWLGAFAYSLQIFYDFSGYSDMAVGLGSILGFKIPENFNYPYISKTFSEFWRRWHISLSTWLKEYLYIPLGGSRCTLTKTCVNLGIVFIVTGLWHGAAWTFVIWGVFHGFFVIIERLLGFNKDTPRPWWQNLAFHIYLLLGVMFAWVFFRAPDLKYAVDFIKNMLFIAPGKTDGPSLVYYADNLNFVAMFFGILFCLPIAKNLLKLSERNAIADVLLKAGCLFLLFASTLEIAVGTYNPFIYFRF